MNADKYTGSTGTVLQHNIFCYCKNAAIIKCDPDGCYDKMATDIINYLKGALLANILTGDRFGFKIMERWFNGLGEKLVIADDDDWNRYFL